jgi:uncharacterized membrane protein
VTVRDIADLVLRWIHLIAGIMWVGNSMLFNWLDRNLERDPGADEKHEGRIWMVHSGGFYDVEKKQLTPSEMPKVLHWFKWQSYTTWLTGASLLVVVYYLGGGTLMVDPQVRSLHPHLAITIGVGGLAGGFLLYDLVWRSSLRKIEWLAQLLTLAIVAGAVALFTETLSGRAAYIHVGALLGTLMAGNVFFHIIPSQRVLVEATKSGKEQDKAFALRAKQRSIHNNYFTFPLLFIMVSNHFPATYGSRLRWAILGVLMVGGALARHFMNARWTFKGWLPSLLGTVAVTLGVLAVLVWPREQRAAAQAVESGPTDTHLLALKARVVVTERCVPCHSQAPTDEVFKAAPAGVVLDTPEQMKRWSERIKVRAVDTNTMPFGNKTQISEDERAVLASWVAAGAPAD